MWGIIPILLSAAATWYAQDQANKRQKEALEAQQGMNTQQISKWTPEQQELFKGLMQSTLKRGFNPGGESPTVQFRSPTAINRAFQSTGNVPSYGR
jgi:hypothetical protein